MTYEEYKEARKKGLDVYNRAKENNLTKLENRLNDDVDHHPKSVELMKFIEEHDFNDCDDSFCWKVGGDGDNGESLMYEMDAYFEQKDIDEKGE